MAQIVACGTAYLRHDSGKCVVRGSKGQQRVAQGSRREGSRWEPQQGPNKESTAIRMQLTRAKVSQQ